MSCYISVMHSVFMIYAKILYFMSKIHVHYRDILLLSTGSFPFGNMYDILQNKSMIFKFLVYL